MSTHKLGSEPSTHTHSLSLSPDTCNIGLATIYLSYGQYGPVNHLSVLWTIWAWQPLLCPMDNMGLATIFLSYEQHGPGNHFSVLWTRWAWQPFLCPMDKMGLAIISLSYGQYGPGNHFSVLRTIWAWQSFICPMDNMGLAIIYLFYGYPATQQQPPPPPLLRPSRSPSPTQPVGLTATRWWTFPSSLEISGPHRMLLSRTPSTGLRHPSSTFWQSLQEGAGKRCSECGCCCEVGSGWAYCNVAECRVPACDGHSDVHAWRLLPRMSLQGRDRTEWFTECACPACNAPAFRRLSDVTKTKPQNLAETPIPHHTATAIATPNYGHNNGNSIINIIY